MYMYVGVFVLFILSLENISASGAASWSSWIDRDNPSGNEDSEDRENLEKGLGGGMPCQNPAEIECRTVGTHIPALETGQVFRKDAVCSLEGGLVCVNNEQRPGSQCLDYEIRFLCSMATPTASWSSWIDRDDPSGTADKEDRESLEKGLGGGMPCQNPVDIDCRKVGTHIHALRTGQVFKKGAVCSLEGGLVCVNNEQRPGSHCLDYEIRFLCPMATSTASSVGSWSSWIDRDDASGSGDWEDRWSLENGMGGGMPCKNPIGIECRTVGSHTPASETHQVFMPGAECSLARGLMCQNSDQRGGAGGFWCLDYEVRYLCPK
ncbi:unnamed protein product [Owenia fusiformis]|uniref:WxxW domain-containing protein n=1 Tax=Owenia fusiformis TaxID=6347 RepID=A0A8S4PXW4_OWEFU|nr:unnamed protein product [Owenia fusiformis]